MTPEEQIIRHRRIIQQQQIIRSANSEEREELKDISDKANSLKIENNQLKDDKNTAKLCNVALAKKENDQKLNEDEVIAMRDIKNTYPYFFESEDEESDPEIETSPEYKERKRVARVIESINQDLDANANEIRNTSIEWNIALSAIASRMGAETVTSVSESSNTAASVSESSSSVTSAPESSSSVNRSPSDYVDSLPREYNPFDDLGDD